MIPFSIILIIWTVAMAIYGLLSLFSVIHMVRFSVAGPASYAATSFFLIIAATGVVSTLLFFMSVDWSQSIDLGTMVNLPLPF